jgi:phosphatidate cytidylyltransferase
MISGLNKYTNLTQRVIAALIGGLSIIGLTYASPWGYFGVFFLICTLSLLEFYKLVGIDGMIPLTFWGTLSGVTIFCLTFLVEMDILHPDYYYIIFPLVSVIFFIKLYKRDEKKPFTNIAFTFLGIVYVAVPFSLLNLAAFSLSGYSYQIVLGSLLLLWSSDTGAYFAGTKFGKTKLFERVSPKKSWEGSIGGTIAAFVMAFGLSFIFQDLELWKWLIIAGIMVMAGTYGDLVESLFKRSMDIKDSGTFIPGHGGFLDRFDGLLLSVPFIIFFLRIF